MPETEPKHPLLAKHGLQNPVERGYVRVDIESKLDYKVEPGRNYRAEIDREVPAWREAPSMTVPGSSATFHDPNDPVGGKPNLMFNPTTGKEWAMPHYKYVRAIHPNGNIQPLIVSSCRPGPTAPGGDDQLGTEDRVIGQKRREKGWLVLEEGSEYNGRTGDEYLAWAFAVAEWRKVNYNLNEAADRVEHQSKAEILQREFMKQQGIATGAMIQDMGKAIASALIESREAPPKRGKAE